MTKLAPLLVLALIGCSPARPTAADVCGKLAAAGIGGGCHEVKAEMLNARAKTKFDLDLAEPKGKSGAVLEFADDDAYDATVKAFEAAAMLAGPHRYGSKKAGIFVQLNSGASLETGKKAKAIVDAL